MQEPLIFRLPPAHTSTSELITERVFLLLMLLPWALLLQQAQGNEPKWRRVWRWLLAALAFERLIVEYPLWSPVVCLLVTVWAVAFESAAQTASARVRRAAPVVLIGCIVASLTAHLPDLQPVRWLVCAWLPAGLLWNRYGFTAWAQRSPADWVLLLLAATALFAGVEGLVRPKFLLLIALGGVGWIGVAFSWSQRRRSAADTSRLGKAAVPLALVAAALPAALLPLECYFRYVYDASNPNMFLRTAKHWKERHVRLNDWGFRDQPFEPLEQYADHLRIALLGDSFTFGQGINEVDDLLHAQLQQELRARWFPDRPLRVFNLSRFGTGTEDERLIFARSGTRLRPEVVVLAYYFNDIPLPQPLPHRTRDPLAPWRRMMRASDFLEFFTWHLYLFVCTGEPGDLPHTLAPYADDAAFATHAATLRQLMRDVRQAGARPVAVIYPTLGIPSHTGPQARATELVENVFAECSVPTVDVGRLVDVRDARYFANLFDRHPSADLHAAVAPALAQLIAEQLSGPAPGE